MSIETKILDSLMEQGILGTILIIMTLMFKKFIGYLFKVVENNTAAMTKTTDVMYEVKKTIEKCSK